MVQIFPISSLACAESVAWWLTTLVKMQRDECELMLSNASATCPQ